MNYAKIYESFIVIRKQRTNELNEYYEKHHIIPKCLGGTNEKENLVLLTAREHYFAHKLLTYVYKGNKKILLALCYMSFDKKHNFLTAKDYENAKKTLSKLQKNNKHGIGNKSNYLKKLTDRHKEKISNSHKGLKHSNETKLKLSLNHYDCKGKNNPMYNKGYLLAGAQNGMYNNGHLLTGIKNGRAKIYIITTPKNEKILFCGNVSKFVKNSIKLYDIKNSDFRSLLNKTLILPNWNVIEIKSINEINVNDYLIYDEKTWVKN